eukprot:UN16921
MHYNDVEYLLGGYHRETVYQVGRLTVEVTAEAPEEGSLAPFQVEVNGFQNKDDYNVICEGIGGECCAGKSMVGQYYR